jgi:hypothetical protein
VQWDGISQQQSLVGMQHGCRWADTDSVHALVHRTWRLSCSWPCQRRQQAAAAVIGGKWLPANWKQCMPRYGVVPDVAGVCRPMLNDIFLHALRLLYCLVANIGGDPSSVAPAL